MVCVTANNGIIINISSFRFHICVHVDTYTTVCISVQQQLTLFLHPAQANIYIFQYLISEYLFCR